MTIINVKFFKEQLHLLLVLSLYWETVFILYKVIQILQKFQVMKKRI